MLIQLLYIGVIVNEKLSYYGSSVPQKETMRIQPPSTFDVFNPGPIDQLAWKSTARLTQEEGIKKKSDIIVNKNIDREALETYRKSWTSDTPASRTMRFKTEARIAGNAIGDPFSTVSVRILPGTPRALETYREKLLERHGVLALSCLKYYIRSNTSNDTITSDLLKESINKTEVPITHANFYQILAYFTPHDTLNSEQFIRTVVAKTDGFTDKHAHDVYDKLLINNNTIEYMRHLLSYDVHPEVAEGIALYLPAYSQVTPESINRDEFAQLYSDIYASSPTLYAAAIENMWVM